MHPTFKQANSQLPHLLTQVVPFNFSEELTRIGEEELEMQGSRWKRTWIPRCLIHKQNPTKKSCFTHWAKSSYTDFCLLTTENK